ncbi:MAG: FAD-dependent oxidoreductase [Deltaproteobacteria bacterium]|nr:FAD-dependent oxidoreductase [Deltaproteobacteria bacterium]
MPERSRDVVVLGGGAGGVPAAIRAAQLGGRVVLVEGGELGGLCMNRGCVPYGHMMAAAGILGSLGLGKEMGIHFGRITTDYGTLIARQESLIAFMREGVRSTLKKRDVRIIQGRGRITGKGRVEVNGEVLHFERLILATGAGWLKPSFPGAELDGVINSSELLKMDKPPGRALLYGRSPWLLEIAQFLHRFGSEVTMATPDKTILPEESKIIRMRLARFLKEQGITVLSGVEIAGLNKDKEGLRVLFSGRGRGEELVFDRVISIRRKAWLSNLGLDILGLDDKAEYVEVNERMETSVPGIYAIGDLTSPETMHYSHLSSAGGMAAAENAMGGNSSFHRRSRCRILFTRPQVACVGLTGKEATRAGYDIITGAAPLSMNPFGMLISQTEGIVEVVAEKKYGEVLGVHFIGEGAAEMAGQGVIAIQMEATLEELARAAFPHPTLSESLAEAARDALGTPIYLP